MSIYDTVIDALQHALWTVAPVAIGLAALLISYICAQWARPLGGLIYTAFCLPVFVPKLGRLYRLIFVDIFRFSFVFKLIGWIVSASGILFPLVLLQLISHEYAAYPAFLWGIFTSSILVTLHIMHDAHLMEIPDFHEHSRLASRWLKVNLQNLSQDRLLQLSRAHFSDLTIVNIFMIVICYAVTAYCGKSLGLFGDITSLLTDDISSAFTFLQYITGDPLRLNGTFGYIVRVFYGASIFVYMVFFISLAPTLIEVRTSNAPIPLEIMNEILRQAVSSSSPSHSDSEDR